MTNDDKLRRLREAFVAKRAVWADVPSDYGHGRVVQCDDDIASIDYLLAEPTSPAPAAAPGEAVAAIVQAVSERPYCSALEDDPDELTVSRSDLVDIIINRWPTPPNEAEIAAWKRRMCNVAVMDVRNSVAIELGDLAEEGVALMRRAATAPAASPPVTSEAIEAAIRRYRSECIAPAEECGGEEMALRNIRALIATAIAEARGSSGLREALVELRKRLDLPGHAECPHPKECPWSDDHEMVAIIDRALAADAKEQTK